MPLIDYNPEALTHPRSPDKRVAPLSAGELIFSLPGAQPVDRILWNKTIKSPEYGEKLNEYIDRGVLTIVADDERPSLAGMNPTQAAKLVKDCFDLELLEHWREDEVRATLSRLLDAKIKELTPPPAEK
jgi:hypothetical protein